MNLKDRLQAGGHAEFGGAFRAQKAAPGVLQALSSLASLRRETKN